jgi:hypothetical protein
MKSRAVVAMSFDVETLQPRPIEVGSVVEALPGQLAIPFTGARDVPRKRRARAKTKKASSKRRAGR